MLAEVKPCNDRVGSMVVVGLLNDSTKSGTWKIPPTLKCQVSYYVLCLLTCQFCH